MDVSIIPLLSIKDNVIKSYQLFFVVKGSDFCHINKDNVIISYQLFFFVKGSDFCHINCLICVENNKLIEMKRNI